MKENNNNNNNGAAALVKHIKDTLEDLGRLTDDAAKSESIKKYWSSAPNSITTAGATKYSYLCSVRMHHMSQDSGPGRVWVGASGKAALLLGY